MSKQELLSQEYNHEFFNTMGDWARTSAEEIVPLVLRMIPCRSLIDVGCGDGTWLQIFREQGVTDILGVDGDYVDESIRKIPADHFMSFDLKQPLRLGRQFDLAISLEVAEHLPAACAATFVESLTQLSPIILFSAAIPLQGGTHHINEQWPEYWIQLFEEQGYLVIDGLRGKVWNNPKVTWFYAQNMLLFAHPTYLTTNCELTTALESTDRSRLSLVHPRLHLRVAEHALSAQAQLDHLVEMPESLGMKTLLKALPKAIVRSLKRRVG